RAEPTRRDTAPTDDDATEDAHSGGPVPLPRRRTPKLVRSNGRPVTHARPQDSRFPDDRPQESRFSGGKAQESRPSEDTRFPADSRFRTDDRPQTDSRFPTDGRLPRERRFQEDRSSESRPLDPAAEDGTPS
ncbi:hypothetical protein G3I23_10585, partial [Streptomyces sp. SID10115]|nr:hypothetical protein [Streptomyces sp. SID10115]